ncbi:putative mitochondrial chaperone BCS1-B [Ananas comosus]|uniref:Putative mitochondrial chaperone BCS1-B n=1 Tax=Ananas comosus TaxID=4615 RepID=A0A199VMY5_ANACO|nr:putative mitochondrial chaperone BCS1-B [Ananas comosus]
MESWIGLGSALGSLAFLYPMVQMYFPQQLQSYLAEYTNKLFSYFYPYIQLTIPEYSGEQMSRSDAYANVESYLAASPSVLRRARKLKADIGPNSKKLLITVGEHEEVVDELAGGMKVWWLSSKEQPSSQTITWGGAEDERRYYRLTFHRRHREFVYGSYLPRVQEEGRAAAHPSRFDTLAMDPVKKQEIVGDLIQFRDSKEYYAEIGKVWKRGYLLFGPPGTGKSSMIAAMANLLNYDVYDLELTAIKNNTELRKLFIETTGKSIIVIEDIDCSLDLTGKRNKEKKKDEEPNKNMPPGTNEKEESSKVTLSGLLNFIDGLWSACGGERIIVFTTNHVEKLDKALIRRGRMDKHIEMSYCGFEAFKVLAKNYLRVDNHHRFDEVRQLLEEVRMTPADVAENLMPKSAGEDADTCLERLVEELKKAKEEAMTAAAAAAAAEAVSKDGAVGSG